jgi:hypothetical protein
MSRYLKALLALVTLTLLAACGGGGDGSSFTVNRTWEGTTYSCPTQAKFDVCRAGDCAQCTCTVGCDANAPKVKLAVSMSPSTLPVNQPGTLRFVLNNTAKVNQTIRFTLNTPAGLVFNSAGWFSTPCDQLDLNLGSQSVVAAVMVPANSSCSMDLQKRFTAPASPAAMSLSDLEKIELDGALPSVTVTP